VTIRDAYLEAATSAADLICHPLVVQSWEKPSALPKLTVGALACHLGGQILLTHDLLSAPPKEPEPIALLEHYARASWVRADLDDDVNVSIRRGAETNAHDGAAALEGKVIEALSSLRMRLPDVREPDTVQLPWQGWSLSLDDFLVTRMMEITVHSDDLAVSLDMPTPELPETVLSPVMALLVNLSLRRHGQASVVRALTRKERAPTGITAF